MPAAVTLLERFEGNQASVRHVTSPTKRRPTEVELAHPAHGTVILNDNLPLSERATSLPALDDGLTPPDSAPHAQRAGILSGSTQAGWLACWARKCNRARSAGGARSSIRSASASAHVESGRDQPDQQPVPTLRKPAASRSGHLHAAARQRGYREWQRQRGGNDRMRGGHGPWRRPATSNAISAQSGRRRPERRPTPITCSFGTQLRFSPA